MQPWNKRGTKKILLYMEASKSLISATAGMFSAGYTFVTN